MGLLQKIRSKSDKEKNIISLVLAGFITLTIVILWLGFSPKKDVTKNESDLKLSEISPFETFKEQFGQIKDDFKGNFTKAVEEIDKLTESTTTEEEVVIATTTESKDEVNQIKNN